MQRPDNQSEDEDEQEESPCLNGLSPALGAKRTIICYAPDSENFSDKYHTQPPLPPSQSIRFGPNDFCKHQAISPQQTPSRQNVVFSGSVKRISASTSRNSHHNQVTPKPPSCRQPVMGPSNDEQCRSSAIALAKSSPLLGADEPVPMTQAFSQEGLLGDIGGIDVQPTAVELPNLHVGDNDRAEGLVGFKDGAEGRVFQRILPPSVKAASLQTETSSTSTDSFEEDPGQQKGDCPMRQRMNPKPFPETLMDVIVHYSGEPPSRPEDVDIVEVAINAALLLHSPQYEAHYKPLGSGRMS